MHIVPLKQDKDCHSCGAEASLLSLMLRYTYFVLSKTGAGIPVWQWLAYFAASSMHVVPSKQDKVYIVLVEWLVCSAAVSMHIVPL